MMAVAVASTVLATLNVVATMTAVATAAATTTVVVDAALMGWFVGVTRMN